MDALNVLTQMGFTKISDNNYYQSINGFFVTVTANSMDIKVVTYCAPTDISLEGTVNDFVRSQSAGIGTDLANSGYSNHRIEFRFYLTAEEKINRNVQNAVNVIIAASSRYKLIPVCMKCGRASEVKILTYNGKTGPLCDFCANSSLGTASSAASAQQNFTGYGNSTSGTSTQPTNGYGYGNSTTGASTQPTGGYGYGSNATGASTQPTGGYGYGSSSATDTSTQPTGGYGYGNSATRASTQPVGGYGYGNSATGASTQPVGGYGYGNSATGASTQPVGGYGYGNSTTDTSTQPTGDYGYGNNTSEQPQQNNGFSYNDVSSTYSSYGSGGYPNANVPMNRGYGNPLNQPDNFTKELMISILGGLGGGLAGAILWVIFSFFGRIVFISGIVAGYIATLVAISTGGNKRGIKILAAIISSLVVFGIGMYFGLAVDVYTAFDGALTFDQSMGSIPLLFRYFPEAKTAFLLDSGLGLLTFVVGVVITFTKKK